MKRGRKIRHTPAVATIAHRICSTHQTSQKQAWWFNAAAVTVHSRHSDDRALVPGIRAVKEGVRAGAGSGFVTGKNLRYETEEADV